MSKQHTSITDTRFTYAWDRASLAQRTVFVASASAVAVTGLLAIHAMSVVIPRLVARGLDMVVDHFCATNEPVATTATQEQH